MFVSCSKLIINLYDSTYFLLLFYSNRMILFPLTCVSCAESRTNEVQSSRIIIIEGMNLLLSEIRVKYWIFRVSVTALMVDLFGFKKVLVTFNEQGKHL